MLTNDNELKTENLETTHKIQLSWGNSNSRRHIRLWKTIYNKGHSFYVTNSYSNLNDKDLKGLKKDRLLKEKLAEGSKMKYPQTPKFLIKQIRLF